MALCPGPQGSVLWSQKFAYCLQSHVFSCEIHRPETQMVKKHKETLPCAPALLWGHELSLLHAIVF